MYLQSIIYNLYIYNWCYYLFLGQIGVGIRQGVSKIYYCINIRFVRANNGIIKEYGFN